MTIGIICGAFYLLLVCFVRAQKCASDEYAFPEDRQATAAGLLLPHALALLLWSIPGLVLLLSISRTAALLGVVLLLAGFCLLTVAWRIAIRLRWIRNAYIIWLARGLLWLYMLQLVAAGAVRVLPAVPERVDDQGQKTPAVYKGANPDTNVLPLIGILSMAHPDSHYIEYVADDGTIIRMIVTLDEVDSDRPW